MAALEEGVRRPAAPAAQEIGSGLGANSEATFTARNEGYWAKPTDRVGAADVVNRAIAQHKPAVRGGVFLAVKQFL